MDHFKSIQGRWFVEDVPLENIAKSVGTPVYVYSKASLEEAWQSFDKAFLNRDHQIHYAVKANSNLAILNIFARLQSGFDIVSQGELERVLKAGGDPKKIIFSGVGKTTVELTKALAIGLGCINVESKSELLHLNQIAASLGKKATIALRVNPDVDPKSHPYISTGLKENKFGVTLEEAKTLYDLASQLSHIQIEGIAFHIGSQITHLSPFLEALDKIFDLIHALQATGIKLSHLNVGGGLGITYYQEVPPTPQQYVEALMAKINDPQLKIYIEPGRSLTANAGVLLTEVIYIKSQHHSDKYFAIVDAAMNDLLRPALYEAWQEIIPLNTHFDISPNTYDIVGPVCETADFLGKNRVLSLKPGDRLMIRSAGAYGFSMSSNYNSRPRAAEVMVNGNTFEVVRPRETLADLFKNEKILSS